MRFNKLRKDGINYYITHKKNYDPLFSFCDGTIEKAYDFAFGMTFGHTGEHRKSRSGGQKPRKIGEIFINTFQGKLCEFGIFEVLKKNFLDVSEPDIEKWELGKWDVSDINVKDKKLAVKSTKSYGNLLLLETKDWNNEGEYIPNIESGDSHYDFFILTRLRPNGEQLMKKARILYSDKIPAGINLNDLISSEKWDLDIPGYVSFEELIYVIKDKNILPQNSMLNGRTKMDAENYYVQSGDMKPIPFLIDLLK